MDGEFIAAAWRDSSDEHDHRQAARRSTTTPIERQSCPRAPLEKSSCAQSLRRVAVARGLLDRRITSAEVLDRASVCVSAGRILGTPQSSRHHRSAQSRWRDGHDTRCLAEGRLGRARARRSHRSREAAASRRGPLKPLPRPCASRSWPCGSFALRDGVGQCAEPQGGAGGAERSISADEAMKAAQGRRWIVVVQRVQELPRSWSGVLLRRASRPGFPIRARRR